MGSIAMIRLVFLVLASLCSSPVWAANTIINNGDSGSSVRGKLNTKLNEVINVVQPPYNADNSGATNSDTAIAAAITDACNGVAGIIFFPKGLYKVAAPIIANCIVANGGFNQFTIRGADRINTLIQGNFTGYVLDHPTDIGGSPPYYSGVIGIEHIGVQNIRTDLDAGAIRFNALRSGNYINDCSVSGYTGIEMMFQTFAGSISNCEITSGGNNGVPGTTGIYAGQITVRDTKLISYDIGISTRGAPTVISGTAVETSNFGINIGLGRLNVVRGTVTGTTLNVTQFVAGNGITAGFGYGLGGFGCPGCAPFPNITATPCGGSPCVSTGSYTLSSTLTGGNIGVTQTFQLYGPADSSSGTTIDAFQTERVNAGIKLSLANNTAIRNAIITGSRGVAYQACGATWAATNNGTITYTLCNQTNPTPPAGPIACYVEISSGWNPSGYAQPDGTLCRWNNSNPPIITISGVDNSTTIPNPGTVSALGTVSSQQAYCFQMGTGSSLLMENFSCGINGFVNMDFGSTNPSYQNVTVINYNQSNAVTSVLPTLQTKACTTVINSPTLPALAMHFNDLPTVGGNCNSGIWTTQAGMTYNIIDGVAGSCADGTCTTFGTSVTGGNGSTGLSLQLRWNGSNWTLMGR